MHKDSLSERLALATGIETEGEAEIGRLGSAFEAYGLLPWCVCECCANIGSALAGGSTEIDVDGDGLSLLGDACPAVDDDDPRIRFAHAIYDADCASVRCCFRAGCGRAVEATVRRLAARQEKGGEPADNGRARVRSMGCGRAWHGTRTAAHAVPYDSSVRFERTVIVPGGYRKTGVTQRIGMRS